MRGEAHDIQYNGGQGELSEDISTTMLDQSALLFLNFHRRLNVVSALHDDKSKANSVRFLKQPLKTYLAQNLKIASEKI